MFHNDQLKDAIFIFIISLVSVSFSSVTIASATASTDEQNFSIVVLPDTQHYSECYPGIFTNQTQWIVDNQDRLNIKFVIHEGDIVEDADNDTQWMSANKSMSVLDGKIPYGILPGNHDENVTLGCTPPNTKSIFPQCDIKTTRIGVEAMPTIPAITSSSLLLVPISLW